MNRESGKNLLLSALAAGCLLGMSTRLTSPEIGLVPWKCVGGCGAGGSSSTGSQARWIGKGVSGTILDAEIRGNFSSLYAPGGGETRLQIFSMPLKLNFHFQMTHVSVYIPFASKTQLIQGVQIAGMGDLGLSLSKKMGISGKTEAVVTFNLPTGADYVYSGNNQLQLNDMQPGAGVYGLSLGLDREIDREWGLFLLGVNYATGLFYNKVIETSWDRETSRASPSKRQFSLAKVGKNWYTNSRNEETGDNVNAFLNAGINAGPLTHSFGVSANIPLRNGAYWKMDGFSELGKDSYTSRDAAKQYFFGLSTTDQNDTTRYDFNEADSSWFVTKNIKQIDKAWPMLIFNYGMEIKTKEIPLFWALSTMLEFDRDEGIGFNGFALELGIKFGLY